MQILNRRFGGSQFTLGQHCAYATMALVGLAVLVFSSVIVADRWVSQPAWESDLAGASACAKGELSAKLGRQELVTKRDVVDAQRVCQGSPRERQVQALQGPQR